jgi:hypothetical protein
MKDVSAKGGETLIRNQMLKRAWPEKMPKHPESSSGSHDTFRVQHDNGVWLLCFVIPNQVLNLALKQVMSSWTCFRIRINDFEMSVFWFREFGF